MSLYKIKSHTLIIGAVIVFVVVILVIQFFVPVASQTNRKPKLSAEDTAQFAIMNIAHKEMAGLSELVHPQKGVRFTPYGYVNKQHDLIFQREKISKLFDDEDEYYWGRYDGSGEEIMLTFSEYYDVFIYDQDFEHAEYTSYNELKGQGNTINNIQEAYEDPFFVEYHFSGFNSEYGGMDWVSLILVFEEFKGSWYLVGVVHNQWTI